MNNFWQILWAVLYAMNMCIAIYASVAMIMRRSDPVKTLSWIVVMILIPYFGVILYLTFGQTLRRKRSFLRKGMADLRLKKELSQVVGEENYSELLNLEAFKPYKKLIYQNLKNSYSLLDFNREIEFYFKGKDALEAMYEAISEAKQHIHLQTYILEEDFTGSRFVKLLIKKALEGVEVCLIFDGMGGIHLKKSFLNSLKQSGIEVLTFAPLKTLSSVNYRNHRKILVVDGRVGFLGGVNIADRYYYGTETGDWYDTQIRLIGESVSSLQASFQLDRYFILNKKFRFRKKYYPKVELDKKALPAPTDNFYAQIISSGPDSTWAGIMQCYFTAICSASDHIYIVSPYFTPNETILNAIKIAALGGIDVKIMLPEKSDSLFSRYSTHSYISELLKAGVSIYLFKEGFNHSKVISVDGKMCIIGSANMDMRSFEHNFEVMSVLYNKECSSLVEKQFSVYLKECDLINIHAWRKRPLRERVKESFFRLLAPLM